MQAGTKHVILILPTPPPSLLEFNLATPVAHQMIALLLGNNMMLSVTEAPLKKTSLA